MTDEPRSPLNFLLREMVAVHKAGMYYAAIMLALTFPDICSKLTFAPSDEKYWKGTQERYEDWCEKYLSKRLASLTAQDLWALRGGVLHQGQTFGHPKSRFSRVVFILPDKGSNQFQIGKMSLQDEAPVSAISTSTFCNAFLDAVREFIAATKDDPIVQANVTGLVRFRPEGFERYILGTPVIA
jgi:hypothetical protein